MIKVLYVDDDDDIREIAVMSLELDPEFDVRTCSSGAQAIETVAQWQPDVVLLDVMMPGMDGPATLAAMQANFGADTPTVLFCTARAQGRDIDHYMKLGAAGVVTKPFDPMTLATEVKGYLS